MIKIRVGSDDELDLTPTILRHPTLLGNFVAGFMEEDTNIIYHVTEDGWGMQCILDYYYDDADATRQILVTVIELLQESNRF